MDSGVPKSKPVIFSTTAGSNGNCKGSRGGRKFSGGVLNPLVIQGWFIISAKVARLLGSVTSMREMRFLHSEERGLAKSRKRVFRGRPWDSHGGYSTWPFLILAWSCGML